MKFGRVTKVKVVFLVLVFVFKFDLFKFSAAILEKGLFHQPDQEKQGGEGEEERRVEFRNRFHIFFFRFLHRK